MWYCGKGSFGLSTLYTKDMTSSNYYESSVIELLCYVLALLILSCTKSSNMYFDWICSHVIYISSQIAPNSNICCLPVYIVS